MTRRSVVGMANMVNCSNEICLHAPRPRCLQQQASTPGSGDDAQALIDTPWPFWLQPEPPPSVPHALAPPAPRLL